MKNNNHTVMLRHFGQWINLEAAAVTSFETQ